MARLVGLNEKRQWEFSVWSIFFIIYLMYQTYCLSYEIKLLQWNAGTESKMDQSWQHGRNSWFSLNMGVYLVWQLYWHMAKHRPPTEHCTRQNIGIPSVHCTERYWYSKTTCSVFTNHNCGVYTVRLDNVYIYIYVCVCVCIYVYMYVCVCVCVLCVCLVCRVLYE